MVILCESKVAESEKENGRNNRLHQKCLEDVAEGKRRAEEYGREREDCTIKSLALNDEKMKYLVGLKQRWTVTSTDKPRKPETTRCTTPRTSTAAPWILIIALILGVAWMAYLMHHSKDMELTIIKLE